MTDISQQIEAIEKEIKETPYHKGTEHHIGKLRAKLSRLKDKLIEESSRRRGSGGSSGYAVRKQGDASVILIGPPSVGKSTLLNKLTNAKSKVAPYAFTTIRVIPGMMNYKDAKIQILDVPGLIEGAEEGKGRGREVLSVARAADLLIIMTDIQHPQAAESITTALEKNGIRINKIPADVKIEKKAMGGIVVHSNIKQDLSKETIRDIALEMGLRNAEITIKEKLTLDKLIDAFSINRAYIPAIYVVNKIDTYLGPARQDQHQSLYISAETRQGLDTLKDEIFTKLKLLRIYLVEQDEQPTYNNPIVVKEGETLSDVALKIGASFAENKTGAKIWGAGSKYPGQLVSLYTPVRDGMQVRFL